MCGGKSPSSSRCGTGADLGTGQILFCAAAISTGDYNSGHGLKDLNWISLLACLTSVIRLDLAQPER
jgi:hypothetical protein